MKKRVLVVEDDPVLTRVLRDNLTFEGFDVQSVADGSQAQSAAKEFAPDLVLLDVNLPGQSGFELCEAWRQRSQVPIILLTAMGQKGDKIRGLQLGRGRLRHQAVRSGGTAGADSRRPAPHAVVRQPADARRRDG